MKRRILQPTNSYYPAPQRENAYEEYDGGLNAELYTEDVLAEVYFDDEEDYPAEDSVLVIPMSSEGGPTTGLITIITLGICLALAFGLLAITPSTVLAVTGASTAAAEIKAEETALAVQPPAVQTAAAEVQGECLVSTLFPAEITQWCGLITQYSAKHQLDPNLVAALIWLESGGNHTAFSRSGAVGLMQVMPSDGPSAGFMCINGPCFSNRPTIEQLNDPEFNISYGTRMLAGLVRKNGSIREALHAYGPLDVGYTYADKVLGLYQRYGK